MSPRRNRPRPAGERSGPLGLPDTESWQGEAYLVRRVPGAATDKHYRCPGCDQEIPPGTPHVVAWPEERGTESRRHWHTSCWSARDRRSARLQRSRNAPRY